MTISRTNASGWGVGDSFTSAQCNSIDIALTTALDRRSGQTDTLASIVSCGGSGRIVDSYAAGADAPTTFLMSGANSIINASAITAPRAYTLSNTGAITGDRLMILNTSNFILTVQDNSTATIAQIGPTVMAGADSTWVDCVFNGVGWIVWRSAKPAVLASTTFTANGTWACPRGVTLALVIGWGAGGGGGGASPTGITTSLVSSTGGGGGGGAQQGVALVSVSPLTGYVVTIGVGGTSGAGSAQGGDGGQSSFSSLAIFNGGGGGTAAATAAATTSSATYGGSPVALNAGVTANFYNGRRNVVNYADFVQAAPGSGGAGLNAAAALASVSGTPSVQGFAGGAGGAFGATAVSAGGGGGGGGGGGPAGVGGAGGAGTPGSNGGATNQGGAGGSPTANTGAGAGGGGGAGSSGGPGFGPPGIGGVGGSGQVIVIPIR